MLPEKPRIVWLKRYWPTLITVVLFLLTGYDIYVRNGAPPVVSRPKPDTYKCTAGPNEKCASDLWYADWRHFADIEKELHPDPKLTEAEIKQKEDEASGIRMRLLTEIPEGMQWDDKKLRFVPLAKPPVSPTQPPEVKK